MWSLTIKIFCQLGCVLVIDDPHKWEGVKIVMVVGTKAMFKFLHKEGPLVASSHLYDYKVHKEGPLVASSHLYAYKVHKEGPLVASGHLYDYKYAKKAP